MENSAISGGRTNSGNEMTGSGAEKNPTLEVSLEEKKFILQSLSAGAQSDQPVKLHPFKTEAE